MLFVLFGSKKQIFVCRPNTTKSACMRNGTKNLLAIIIDMGKTPRVLRRKSYIYIVCRPNTTKKPACCGTDKNFFLQYNRSIGETAAFFLRRNPSKFIFCRPNKKKTPPAAERHKTSSCNIMSIGEKRRVFCGVTLPRRF